MIVIAATAAVMGIVRFLEPVLDLVYIALAGGVLTAIIELVVFWFYFLSVRREKNGVSVNWSKQDPKPARSWAAERA